MATPPDLQMLWEDADPGCVLAERFGLSDAGAALEFVSDAINAHWGLRLRSCEKIVMSDHNALAWLHATGGRRILKWSVAPQRFARLEALSDLTGWLGQLGQPVSAPIPTLDGHLQPRIGNTSANLQRVLPGGLLDVADLGAVQRAGVALAHLHQALRDYPDADTVANLDRPAPLAEQISDWLDSHPTAHPQAAAQLDATRSLTDPQRPVQLVHGDYRSANLLTQDTQISAILDFEEARLDHPVVELARSAVLLGTQFHNWGPVSPQVHTALRDCYETVLPLTSSEAAWWGPLILWWTLMFVPDSDDPTGWSTSLQSQLEPKA